MYVFEHYPSTSLYTFFHGLVSEIKSFSAPNCNRNEFIVSLFADLFNLETGIKTRGTGQENRFFGLTRLDRALEFNCVVVSALWTKDCLDDLIGDGVKLVRSENFHEDKVDNLFTDGVLELNFEFGDQLLW
jgi:hypothetical protein